ncbi:MAG: Asp-tRNA(Asn)/Glu-tRNA(Gln) amidotransferase subunit GatC [Firmicutes bacterium]|nr:Asp-tRNA(Asn)/Glu-tRNA(Gln) amidotransferase subunit GatC [Bacillota bacterium]
MAIITKSELGKIAELAQLELSPDEENILTRQLGEILAFSQQLHEVDTEGVAPTVSVLDQTNVWRSDEVVNWLNQDQALAQAQEVKEGCFKVPRIMEKK